MLSNNWPTSLIYLSGRAGTTQAFGALMRIKRAIVGAMLLVETGVEMAFGFTPAP